MKLQPYLFFGGNCEEALAFYRKAVAADVTMLMRYRDGPMAGDPAKDDKVMHARFQVGETEVMASDGESAGAASFKGFALSLQVKDAAEAARRFAALAEGGEVRMPLAKTFFSPAFGMLADRYGVPWMVVVLA